MGGPAGLRWAVFFLGVVIAMIAAGAGAAPPAAGVEGHWLGTLDTGAIELRIVFHIRKQPDGTLASTLDSLDQGAKGIPVGATSLKNGTLQLDVPAVAGKYGGKLSADGRTLTGTWTQAGASLPLVMKRSAKEPVLRRPQVPKRPYPYREEQVAYDNPAGKSHLAGTLTLPKGKGPFLAVLLISGSGQQDRDESLMGHQPFLVLADALTRRGIAVLRVDDRGIGGSTGEVEKATSEDFASDVLAGVRYLSGRKEIDRTRIGLLGHSEGGLIAPMVAVRSPQVAFLVLIAGPGVRGDRIIRTQSDRILKAAGGTEAQRKQNAAVVDQLLQVVTTEKDPKQAERRLKAILTASPAAAQSARSHAAGEKKSPSEPSPALAAQAEMALTPWFRFFVTYDPQPTLRKVKCPVLAVNGEKDLQVPARENLQAIAAALKAGGNRDVTTKELPGLNHLLQKSATGSPSEYGTIEETMNPVALKLIGDWIVAHTRR